MHDLHVSDLDACEPCLLQSMQYLKDAPKTSNVEMADCMRKKSECAVCSPLRVEMFTFEVPTRPQTRGHRLSTVLVTLIIFEYGSQTRARMCSGRYRSEEQAHTCSQDAIVGGGCSRSVD